MLFQFVVLWDPHPEYEYYVSTAGEWNFVTINLVLSIISLPELISALI